MALIDYSSGVAAWTLDPLATISAADIYASARTWTDWSDAAAEKKAGALLDASTFVRASYRAPALLSAAQTTLIESAVIEAARLALTSPLMGGAAAGQRVKKSVRAGSVAVEYAAADPRRLNADRLQLVTAILGSVGLRRASGVNVPLSKA
jgi:hypothetical protein